MIILLSAVALATAQPAVQTPPAAPSAHGEQAVAHQGRHCCCCDHGAGSQGRDGCAEHMHGAERSGHPGH